jgi:hypothetical protein
VLRIDFKLEDLNLVGKLEGRGPFGAKKYSCDRKY